MRNGEFASQLEASAGIDLRFHLLVVFSCAIATFGLISDSPAVVIGAMLVAPLLTPIMALALGSAGGRLKLLLIAAPALLEGIVVAVVLSLLLAWFAKSLPFDALASLPHEAQVRTRPNPFDLAIALAGGAAGAYALARMPNSDALPGVAIATALMPPLCTVGIGLVLNDRGVWGGAALLFVTNLSAIVFAAIIVFAALGFRPAHWQAGLLPMAATTGLLLVVGITLAGLTLRAIDESRESEAVRSAVLSAIHSQRPESELVDLTDTDTGAALHVRVTVRTSGEVSLEEVEGIQAMIAQKLQRPVALVFVSVPSVILDPLSPPKKSEPITPVPTPTPTVVAPRRVIVLPFQAFGPAVAHD